MPLKKSDIAALQIGDEQKSELTGLFDALEKNETEVTKLRQEKADADKVMSRNKELEKKITEREGLITELQNRIAALATPAPQPAQSDESFLPDSPFGFIPGVGDEKTE